MGGGRVHLDGVLSLVLYGLAILLIVVLVFLYCFYSKRCCEDQPVESPMSLQALSTPVTSQQPTTPSAPTAQMNIPVDVEHQLDIIRAQQELQMALIRQQQGQTMTPVDNPTVPTSTKFPVV